MQLNFLKRGSYLRGGGCGVLIRGQNRETARAPTFGPLQLPDYLSILSSPRLNRGGNGDGRKGRRAFRIPESAENDANDRQNARESPGWRKVLMMQERF